MQTTTKVSELDGNMHPRYHINKDRIKDYELAVGPNGIVIVRSKTTNMTCFSLAGFDELRNGSKNRW